MQLQDVYHEDGHPTKQNGHWSRTTSDWKEGPGAPQ